MRSHIYNHIVSYIVSLHYSWVVQVIIPIILRITRLYVGNESIFFAKVMQNGAVHVCYCN